MQNLVSKLINAKTCLAIMGPTATGKSSLSMAIAQQLDIEIISVDSALIYKNMDIGTAKPTDLELAKVPHHLINIIEPTDNYCVAKFVADAHKLVKEIFARNRLPVFVGGTMMYFNALQKGIAKLPSSNAQVRKKLFELWQTDAQKLHQQLAKIDPKAAARIHYNDSQRVIRAMEVFELTQQSITSLQEQAKDSSLKEFSLKKIALIPEQRTILHKNIAIRFNKILKQGFVQEVTNLMKNEALDQDSTAIRSVGYRQAWSFLLDEYDYDTFIEKSIVATRQLAKRQITWLRKEENIKILNPYQESLAQQVKLTIKWLEEN